MAAHTITFQFVVGGGAFLTFDYRINGGPDHGRRIEVAPCRPRQALEYGKTVYNGPPEEFAATYGAGVRPRIVAPADLHPETVLAAWAAGIVASDDYADWHADCRCQRRRRRRGEAVE